MLPGSHCCPLPCTDALCPLRLTQPPPPQLWTPCGVEAHIPGFQSQVLYIVWSSPGCELSHHPLHCWRVHTCCVVSLCHCRSIVTPVIFAGLACGQCSQEPSQRVSCRSLCVLLGAWESGFCDMWSLQWLGHMCVCYYEFLRPSNLTHPRGSSSLFFFSISKLHHFCSSLLISE